MSLIKVKDYTLFPGARHISDGPGSGEEFFEKYLKPTFKGLKDGEDLIVDLDGTEGYATSFLSEAFSQLGKLFSSEIISKKLKIISIEEPHWAENIMNKYIYGKK